MERQAAKEHSGLIIDNDDLLPRLCKSRRSCSLGRLPGWSIMELDQRLPSCTARKCSDCARPVSGLRRQSLLLSTDQRSSARTLLPSFPLSIWEPVRDCDTQVKVVGFQLRLPGAPPLSSRASDAVAPAARIGDGPFGDKRTLAHRSALLPADRGDVPALSKTGVLFLECVDQCQALCQRKMICGSATVGLFRVPREASLAFLLAPGRDHLRLC